jgi:predicted Zn-dependent protease
MPNKFVAICPRHPKRRDRQSAKDNAGGKMRSRMKMMALLLPMSLSLASCATTPGGPSLNFVSKPEEIRLGKELSTKIEQQESVLQNPVLEQYVSEVGQRVARQAGTPEIPYSFKIIDRSEVNAFSLPGGPVYVYTGLLKIVDNEAELAGVLAHEVAHVAARHATEQLTRKYGVELVTEVLLGQNPNVAAQVAGDIAGSLGLLKFSRTDEIEADRLGTEYLFRAGYNPTAMITVHEKLAALQKTNPSLVLNLFSTHPISQSRIDAIAEEMAMFPPGANVGYYTERYHDTVDRELR